MNINIKTIPHNEQAYETVGDWRFDDNGDLNIFVSSMNNWKYELLVAFHELAEVAMCKDRGITTEEVDAFDIKFEEEREKGLHGDDEEAGDDVNAPYRKEHFTSTNLERILARELDVDWKTYDDMVMGL